MERQRHPGSRAPRQDHPAFRHSVSKTRVNALKAQCGLRVMRATGADLILRGTEHLGAVEVLLGRGPPHAGLSRGPALRALRRVVMPGAGLEIAELLVLHLVELAEEFDHL